MPLLAGNLKVLETNGCQLAYPPELFWGLMKATHNDPCTTGCAYFEGGKCKAYRQFHTDCQPITPARPKSTDPFGLIGGKWAGMTTAQIIAAEGGISRNEFQKRKQRGDYKQ